MHGFVLRIFARLAVIWEPSYFKLGIFEQLNIQTIDAMLGKLTH